MGSWWTAGRSNDLSQFAAAIVAKRRAAITGPTGVGKTTLAVTHLQLAQAEGTSLARTTGTRASRASPFGAFTSVLPPDSGGDGLIREDHLSSCDAMVRLYQGGRRPLLVGQEGAADK